MKHDFSDVAKHGKAFDGPERVAWQKPDHVVALMAIRPGMTVVDLGAGTGFFEPPLAAAVGAEGKVLALDVEPNMVEHLKRASRRGGPRSGRGAGWWRPTIPGSRRRASIAS